LNEPVSGIYIFHFDKPVRYARPYLYGGESHYVGASKDVTQRVAEHEAGKGSIATRTALKLEVPMVLVAVLPIAGRARYDLERTVITIGPQSFCHMCMDLSRPKKPGRMILVKSRAHF
jgi:hypothetical protein